MKKILILDDDTALRAVLPRYLAERGFEVQSAASGLEGLRVFQPRSREHRFKPLICPLEPTEGRR